MGTHLSPAGALSLGCLVWGLFLPLLHTFGPFPFVVNLTRGLVPCCVYALPTLSDMAPSL